ncbi:MAG: hypothetical protein ABR920_16405, partial [Terriglobales bacterium]
MSLETVRRRPVPELVQKSSPLGRLQLVQCCAAVPPADRAPRAVGPSVVGEEFAVSKDDMEMFGVLDLETSFEGCRFAIGIRNANN